MNKLVLPAVLVAVVIIAAGFAFAPIEQATTVHVNIIDELSDNYCKITLSDSEAFFSGTDCIGGG